MSSDKQKSASRANGAKSRGPVTPEGKRRSARNSLNHGLLARTLLLEGESRDRFHHLLNSLHNDLQPETVIEHMLVQKMAAAHWRQMRVWGMEKASIAHESSKQQPGVAAEDSPTRDAIAFRALGDRSGSSGLMNQYEMRYDRQFARSLEQFLKLREARMNQFFANEPGK